MTTVWVKTQSVASHCWPDAPDHRAYLRDTHRHVFHVEAEVTVTGHDREVEFHDLLDLVNEYTPQGHQGSQSCEMMAERIMLAMDSEYPGRLMRVTVSEDGECGATVIRNA